MHRETSPTVSSIAATLINFRPPNLIEIIDSGDPDKIAEFCADVRTLAGSALSQDETPFDDPDQNKLDLASPLIGEPVEVGGHNEDRDGPVPFNG